MSTTTQTPPQVTLASLVAFEQVARRMSFARAARELEVTPTAISKTVKALEAQMGVRLFNRTTRSVSLTEHGALLLESLSPALALIKSSVQQVAEEASKPKGLLRINTSYVAYAVLIQPYIAAFTKQFPDVQIDFAIDDKLVDIVGNGYDAGIRAGRSLQKDMIAVPLGGPLHLAVVASPDYLREHGTPDVPQALLDYDCIRQRFVSPTRFFEWKFNANGAPLTVEVSGRLIYSEMRSAMDAARRGLGLAYVYRHFADEYIGQGQLVPLLEDQCVAMEGFYLYYPNRSHMPGKLRAFIAFMQEANRVQRHPHRTMADLR